MLLYMLPVDKVTFNPMNLSIFVSFLNKPLPITVRSSWSYTYVRCKMCEFMYVESYKLLGLWLHSLYILRQYNSLFR